jgi:hypothetical protein
MKFTAKPIRSTIIWGLIGGLGFLGSYWRAWVYSLMCRLKPLYVLAGEFSGVTLGIAGRIRSLAVTLGS